MADRAPNPVADVAEDARSAPDRPPRTSAGALLRLARPRQWLKNVLVFAAPGAAGVLLHVDDLARIVLAFASLSAAASAVYVLNDLADREADRRHPVKRRRPIAAGTVSVPAARVYGVALVALAFALGAPLGWDFEGLVALYLVLTTSYSTWLKHEPLLDVALVASGFVIRAVAGGVAVDVPISRWFLIVTSFGSLFIVTGKRFGEHREFETDAERHGVRRTLVAYSPDFLRYLYTTASAVTLTSYCLWAFETAQAHPSGPWLGLSIVPFTLGVLRYALLLDMGRGSEPEEIVLGDRLLQLFGLVWIALFAAGVIAVR